MAKKVKKSEKKSSPVKAKAKVAPKKKASKLKVTLKARKSSVPMESASRAHVKKNSPKLAKKANTKLVASKSEEKDIVKGSSKTRNEKSAEKLTPAASAASPVKLGILQKRPATDKPKAKDKDKDKNKKNDNATESTSDVSLNGQNARWLQLYRKYGNLEATQYDMTKQFEERKPIQHPKLGWGFILSIVNDRLEVLFQEGIKTLISNYNPDLKI
jgi:hypothetical protein